MHKSRGRLTNDKEYQLTAATEFERVVEALSMRHVHLSASEYRSGNHGLLRALFELVRREMGISLTSSCSMDPYFKTPVAL